MSFVSWELWRTGIVQIPLIEHLVSSRWCLRRCVRVVKYNPDHDYEMRQLRIFQKMVERGKSVLHYCLQLGQMMCQILCIVTTGRFIIRLRHARPWLKPSWCIKMTMSRIRYTLHSISICSHIFPPLPFKIWLWGRQKSNFWFGLRHHGR